MSSRPARRPKVKPPQRTAARDRIDKVAYELFSRRGIKAVGIDEVIARAGVAKMTLYRHYPSKNDLVLSFLREREQRWTRAWLQARVQRRGKTAADRLLAVFDVFHIWFQQSDFEGCSFINVLLETEGARNPVRLAAVEHLAGIRTILRDLGSEAGVADPDGFARQWHILMKGSIIAAAEGDRQAARRARDVGQLLLMKEGVLSKNTVKHTTRRRDPQSR